MLVCAFFCAHCTRDRGCSAHPVFPAPSVLKEGERRCKPRADSVARSRRCVFSLAPLFAGSRRAKLTLRGVGVRGSLQAFDSRIEPLTRRYAPTSPREGRGEVTSERWRGCLRSLGMRRPKTCTGHYRTTTLFFLFHAVFAAFNPSFASTASRIRNFWILPVTVIGNSSTNST